MLPHRGGHVESASRAGGSASRCNTEPALILTHTYTKHSILALTRTKIQLYFLNLVYKVRAATHKIRQEMCARSRATCPELAEATGLSLVTVHKEVRHLCSRGELRAVPEAASRGGRPAIIYEYEARYARRALLELSRQGAVMQVQLTLSDLQGRPLSTQRGAYASLERESLDGMLDTALHRQRVASIGIIAPSTHAPEDMRTHLQQRFHCPVICVNTAKALADEHEGTATLYLRHGMPPECCLRRGGKLHSAGRLDLLPLPTTWETLDYSDRTLVEEMVARLLHILTCTLAPARIVLHADFWSTRLIDRIRFNTESKLRGAAAPTLHFRHTTGESAHNARHIEALRGAAL